MFLNWLRRKAIDRQRKIFRYWDGTKWRRVDPLEKWFAIVAHPKFDPETHGPAFDRGDSEAWKIVAECARDVFDVPAFTNTGEPGLTMLEVIDIFKSFLNYCELLKKSIGVMPIMQEPTTTPNGSISSVAPQSDMSALSASPSIQKELDFDTPGCC